MTNSSYPPSTQRTGLHIYMGGVGLQLLYIAIFLTLCIRFQLTINQLEKSSLSAGQGVHMSDLSSPRSARRLLCLVYTVLFLIVFRNIYRLVEFSSGIYSTITEHEWFAYVFDAVPMFSALVAFNIFHPGRVLRGPNSDFAEDRKREKAAKRAKKQAKRLAREDRKKEKVRGLVEIGRRRRGRGRRRWRGSRRRRRGRRAISARRTPEAGGCRIYT
jgi:hypothetical protein